MPSQTTIQQLLNKEYPIETREREVKIFIGSEKILTGDLEIKGFPNLKSILIFSTSGQNNKIKKVIFNPDSVAKLESFRILENEGLDLSETFNQQFPQLKTILINKCDLTSIPILSSENLPNLTQLDLNENLIEKQAINFSLPATLKELSLAKNKLSEFKLLEANNLEELYLQHNKLKKFEVNSEAVQKIKKLRVHNNLLTDSSFLKLIPADVQLIGISNNNLTFDLNDLARFTNLEYLTIGTDDKDSLKSSFIMKIVGNFEDLNLNQATWLCFENTGIKGNLLSLKKSALRKEKIKIDNFKEVTPFWTTNTPFQDLLKIYEFNLNLYFLNFEFQTYNLFKNNALNPNLIREDVENNFIKLSSQITEEKFEVKEIVRDARDDLKSFSQMSTEDFINHRRELWKEILIRSEESLIITPEQALEYINLEITEGNLEKIISTWNRRKRNLSELFNQKSQRELAINNTFANPLFKNDDQHDQQEEQFETDLETKIEQLEKECDDEITSILDVNSITWQNAENYRNLSELWKKLKTNILTFKISDHNEESKKGIFQELPEDWKNNIYQNTTTYAQLTGQAELFESCGLQKEEVETELNNLNNGEKNTPEQKINSYLSQIRNTNLLLNNLEKSSDQSFQEIREIELKIFHLWANFQKKTNYQPSSFDSNNLDEVEKIRGIIEKIKPLFKELGEKRYLSREEKLFVETLDKNIKHLNDKINNLGNEKNVNDLEVKENNVLSNVKSGISSLNKRSSLLLEKGISSLKDGAETINKKGSDLIGGINSLKESAASKIKEFSAQEQKESNNNHERALSDNLSESYPLLSESSRNESTEEKNNSEFEEVQLQEMIQENDNNKSNDESNLIDDSFWLKVSAFIALIISWLLKYFYKFFGIVFLLFIISIILRYLWGYYNDNE